MKQFWIHFLNNMYSFTHHALLFTTCALRLTGNKDVPTLLKDNRQGFLLYIPTNKQVACVYSFFLFFYNNKAYSVKFLRANQCEN